MTERQCDEFNACLLYDRWSGCHGLAVDGYVSFENVSADRWLSASSTISDFHEASWLRAYKHRVRNEKCISLLIALHSIRHV